jgi:hypothetical protein
VQAIDFENIAKRKGTMFVEIDIYAGALEKLTRKKKKCTFVSRRMTLYHSSGKRK